MTLDFLFFSFLLYVGPVRARTVPIDLGLLEDPQGELTRNVYDDDECCQSLVVTQTLVQAKNSLHDI